jgi:hypothetical protein
MFIRIQWAMPNSDGFNMTHTYQCGDYFVGPYKDPTTCGPNGPSTYTHLILDGGKHDIRLGGDDKAYVMNDNGKTIDTIQN